MSALIRAKREALQLSEASVASAAGLSRATYCEIEGRPGELASAVSLQELWMLARALGYTDLELEAAALGRDIDPSRDAEILDTEVQRRLAVNARSVDQLTRTTWDTSAERFSPGWMI